MNDNYLALMLHNQRIRQGETNAERAAELMEYLEEHDSTITKLRNKLSHSLSVLGERMARG